MVAWWMQERTFWSRCRPQVHVLSRRTQFYSKHPLFESLCEQSCKTTNKFPWLADWQRHVISQDVRMLHGDRVGMHWNAIEGQKWASEVSKRSELTPSIYIYIYTGSELSLLAHSLYAVNPSHILALDHHRAYGDHMTLSISLTH